MIKNILIFSLLIFSTVVYSQVQIDSYQIHTEMGFNKTVTSETPASNSVNDIVAVGDTIWIGSSRGVSRTTDNGNSWTNYYQTDAFGTEAISSVHYDNYNKIIWTATAHSVTRDGQKLPEGSGIRFSTNGGLNWIIVPQPIDLPGDSSLNYGINKIRALPVTVAIQNISYDLVTTKNYVWISSFAGGLRRCRIDSLIADPLRKWERILLPPDYLNSISPTDTLNFSLQPVSGKFGKENYLNHRLFSLCAIDDSTLYAGTANGINKTTEAELSANLISWKKFNYQNQDDGISGNFVVALDYNKNTNTIWAATWRAEDKNENPAVSYSSNGGLNWKTALRDNKANNIGLYGAKVIAATDNGAFRSADNGSSWILPGLIIDKTTRLQHRTSVFYSALITDNSKWIWLGSNDGLIRVSGIGGSWDDDWKIFFASQPLTSKKETYAYPNPFSPKSEYVKIKYNTSAANVSVTIRIFDFGMNFIRTIIQNASRSNGIHQISGNDSNNVNGVMDIWDGRDQNGNIVPNGVYFYRIDVGTDDPVFGKIMVLQ